MPKPTQVSVELTIPLLGKVSGVWEPDDAERRAAWELYVELITRVTVVDMRPEDGLLRDALSSIYTLFGSTREVLRRYGPDVAPRRGPGHLSFGALSVAVLNGAVRPFLASWHPALASHEASLPAGADPVAHERSWERADDLRRDLAAVRRSLSELALLLAEVAGVEHLHTQPDEHGSDSEG